MSRFPGAPLVEAADLAGFPGAPFDASVVAAAGDSIRGDARWRIAPQVTETLTLDGPGSTVLQLPTLHLVDVVSIVENGTTIDVSTVDWSEAGYIERSAPWTSKARGIVVTIIHGYDTCPDDLLPAIAYRAQKAKMNQGQGAARLGSLSVNPAGTPNTAAAEAAQPDAVVAQYRITSI